MAQLAPTNQELLDQSLQQLRNTGQIEYTGEFGAEITTFIPFVFWLKQQSLLAGRRVITYRGMRPYYYFLDDSEFVEKAGNRHWLPPPERDWPSNSSYTAVREPWHRMPDYRGQYRDQGRTFQRPVLFIQNKFTVEFDQGPINFLPLDVLDRLFKSSVGRFDVVYSRPRALRDEAGYTLDENSDCTYPDLNLARRYPEVLVLEDWCEKQSLPYNLTKLQMLAKSRLFVTVQGGGAHLLACFGDSLLLLLHKEGFEFPHAYSNGPYKYLADPPPLLLLAQNHEQLHQGVRLIEAVWIENDQIKVAGNFAPVLKALRL